MNKQNAAIIILGASGDLAGRKLIPALNKLFEKGSIAPSSVIIGSGRTGFDDESFRGRFDVSNDFRKRLFYHKGLEGLKEYINSMGSFSKLVVFMSLPPEVYVSTARVLAGQDLNKDNASVIIEKPFGYDYESSRALNSGLSRYYREKQIFRIDHYLAKEAVQNILVFRFANSVFYPVWNSRYIESIQINALEEIGVDNRGAYFDKAGIIRDMVQNHLTQLLCLMTMEAPVTLNAHDIRAQKINVLKAMEVEQCERYQYQGYDQEKNVAPASNTETFAEIKLRINNFRWAGMPVYIRTGKAVNRKGTEIGVKFKSIPRLLFNEKGDIRPNRIIFKIQPSEGIILDLSSRMPGSDGVITGTTMNFCYRDAFEGDIPEAYQKLLLDAIDGDHTLFVSEEETETSWKKFENILDRGELHKYERGAEPPSRFDVNWIDFERYKGVCK
jgi:glucose-6-phosphate 1-dehydrogenase